MKIEICEKTAWVAIILILSIAAVVISISCTKLVQERDAKAIEAGLVQEQLAGRQGVRWVKPDSQLRVF